MIVARNGFCNQCINFVDAVAYKIIIQGLSGFGQLKPALGHIATEEVGVKQVFPKLWTVVVLVVELPHVVSAAVAEGIVTESEVVIPDRASAQFT